jgi:hypothetical protein
VMAAGGGVYDFSTTSRAAVSAAVPGVPRRTRARARVATIAEPRGCTVTSHKWMINFIYA